MLYLHSKDFISTVPFELESYLYFFFSSKSIYEMSIQMRGGIIIPTSSQLSLTSYVLIESWDQSVIW